jgi:hypothetical protein
MMNICAWYYSVYERKNCLGNYQNVSFNQSKIRYLGHVISSEGRGYYGMDCTDEHPISMYLNGFRGILLMIHRGFF